MIDVLIGLVVVVAMAALSVWWMNQMSPAEKWDMAAWSMRTEGYTDAEIIHELGPRPKDREDT